MTVLITTFLYGATAIYLLYNAAMHIFIYIANTNLGHKESMKMPLLFLLSGIVMAYFTIIGYRMYKTIPVPLVLKILFYAPIILLALYLLWALLLILSVGGKWN